MKNCLRFAAVLLLAAVVVVFGGCNVNLRFDTYDKAELYKTGSFDYNAADVSALDIDWVAGGITLVQSENASLSVRESGTQLPGEKQLHWRLDGSTLIIKYCASGYVGEIDPAGKQLTVELPAGIELDINNVSADITAEKLNVTELDIENVSGNVKIGTLEADRAKLETVSGDVTADSITAAYSLDLNSVSGVLRLGEVSAPELEIDSVSGDIELAVKRADDIRLNGTSAGMRLQPSI